MDMRTDTTNTILVFCIFPPFDDNTGREMLFLFSFLFYDENSHNHWQTYKHFHMHIVQHTRAGVNEHENKGGYTYKFLSTKMDKMLIR